MNVHVPGQDVPVSKTHIEGTTHQCILLTSTVRHRVMRGLYRSSRGLRRLRVSAGIRRTGSWSGGRRHSFLLSLVRLPQAVCRSQSLRAILMLCTSVLSSVYLLNYRIINQAGRGFFFRTLARTLHHKLQIPGLFYFMFQKENL
jgi:hypothetical protein